jgi:hypothetical protein
MRDPQGRRRYEWVSYPGGMVLRAAADLPLPESPQAVEVGLGVVRQRLKSSLFL